MEVRDFAIFKEADESLKQADDRCEIFAINEDDVKSTDHNDIRGVIERFQVSKSWYAVSLFYTIDPRMIKLIQDNFDTVSKFTSGYISGFKNLPAAEG